MGSEWRIRVTGKQRQNLDVALLVQAVMALAEQFAEDERKQAVQQPSKSTVIPSEQPGPEVVS